MNVERAELIVLGAGPAGVSAALAAAENGLDVVLIDEADEAGGQVYRAPRPKPGGPADASPRNAHARPDPDAARGGTLRARLAQSPVRFLRGQRVWAIEEHFSVHTVGSGLSCTVTAPRLISAMGAIERVVPFPGWTLPGVIGLAGATILLKSQSMLPGRRMLVAGCGPLLLAVAAKVVEKGGNVAAVVDLAPRSGWLTVVPKLAGRPDLIRQGLAWRAALLRHVVAIHYASTLRSVETTSRGLSAVIGPVDTMGRASPGATVSIGELDCVAVGHGLMPSIEVTRLVGAEHRFERALGGWVPRIDSFGRTTVAGLYAAGDGCGIRGALPAEQAGHLAGLAAARDAGSLSNAALEDLASPVRARLRGLEGFAGAMAAFMAQRSGQVDDVAPDTIVCRCEDVTRHEIEQAIDDGASDVNQVKHFTRCGMGPCQGRMCADTVGELVGLRLGSREAAGLWTQRAPLRPVALEDLIGTYRYSDIPIPKPAPL